MDYCPYEWQVVLYGSWSAARKTETKKAIESLCKVIEKTDDLTLITDGERRYGNFLFEICNELVRTGKRGRPKKPLKKGVKIRIKNKGSQSKKRGRKRPKYESPFSEHPETTQDIENKDIHAKSLKDKTLPFGAGILPTGVVPTPMQRQIVVFK